jgi:hypothetical protein
VWDVPPRRDFVIEDHADAAVILRTTDHQSLAKRHKIRACTGIDQMTHSHTSMLQRTPAGPSIARSAGRLVGTRSRSLATNTSVAPARHQPRRLQPPPPGGDSLLAVTNLRVLRRPPSSTQCNVFPLKQIAGFELSFDPVWFALLPRLAPPAALAHVDAPSASVTPLPPRSTPRTTVTSGPYVSVAVALTASTVAPASSPLSPTRCCLDIPSTVNSAIIPGGT